MLYDHKWFKEKKYLFFTLTSPWQVEGGGGRNQNRSRICSESHLKIPGFLSPYPWKVRTPIPFSLSSNLIALPSLLFFWCHLEEFAN